VAIVAGEAFYADGAGRHEFRLCFARQTPDRIAEGIRRLAHFLASNTSIRLKPSASHPLM
jgi:DNA-binding transcriptional MocR family regulator